MRYFIILLTALFYTSSVQSEPRDITISIPTFSVTSEFKAPPWASSSGPLASSNLFEDEGTSNLGTRYYIWEAIPKDENFENWSQLFAMTAETPMDGDVEGYMNGQINVYSNNCWNVGHYVTRVRKDNARLFVLFCGRYKNGQAKGEVAFFHMQLHNRTLIKNYYHIRVEPYSLNEIDHNYPLNDSEMSEAIKAVSFLEISDRN